MIFFILDRNVIDTHAHYMFNIINDINALKRTIFIPFFRWISFKINKFVQDKLMSLPKQYIEYEYECNNNHFFF